MYAGHRIVRRQQVRRSSKSTPVCLLRYVERFSNIVCLQKYAGHRKGRRQQVAGLLWCLEIIEYQSLTSVADSVRCYVGLLRLIGI